MIATQPQPLPLFAIFRNIRKAGYSLFGKLINLVFYHFFKLLVIFGTFWTWMMIEKWIVGLRQVAPQAKIQSIHEHLLSTYTLQIGILNINNQLGKLWLKCNYLNLEWAQLTSKSPFLHQSRWMPGKITLEGNFSNTSYNISQDCTCMFFLSPDHIFTALGLSSASQMSHYDNRFLHSQSNYTSCTLFRVKYYPTTRNLHTQKHNSSIKLLRYWSKGLTELLLSCIDILNALIFQIHIFSSVKTTNQ